MTATKCEPLEELRGVDGWHWVQAPVGEPHLARWHPAERDDIEPLWTSTHHVYSGTPRYVVREWGWRYLAPAATPATVRALVEALAEIEQSHVPSQPATAAGSDFEWAMMHVGKLRRIATAALARAKAEGLA